VEKVVLSMRMAIYMKATLRRVKEMVKEWWNFLMELKQRDSGLMGR
jgi:hypothetical protein